MSPPPNTTPVRMAPAATAEHADKLPSRSWQAPSDLVSRCATGSAPRRRRANPKQSGRPYPLHHTGRQNCHRPNRDQRLFHYRHHEQEAALHWTSPQLGLPLDVHLRSPRWQWAATHAENADLRPTHMPQAAEADRQDPKRYEDAHPPAGDGWLSRQSKARRQRHLSRSGPCSHDQRPRSRRGQVSTDTRPAAPTQRAPHARRSRLGSVRVRLRLSDRPQPSRRPRCLDGQQSGSTKGQQGDARPHHSARGDWLNEQLSRGVTRGRETRRLHS